MACAQCHYAVHPTARLLRALIAPLAINHDRARTRCKFVTASPTWRLSFFELSVTHRPHPIGFHFPSSPFKHAQCRRAPTRINRSRAALPTYPSQGHVPDGTPSHLVGIILVGLSSFYCSIRRLAVSDAAPGTAGPPFDKASANITNVATSTSTSQPMPIFLNI